MVLNLISIAELKPGQEGIVRSFEGGREVTRKLEALGIRENKHIKKVSGMFMRGPVTVRVGHTQISLGHGMASKVMVEVS